MGDREMILQRKGGYNLITNDTYLCVVGKSLDIYDKKNYSPICSFSDMRNYFWAAFIEKNILIAKNALGVFKVYSLLDSSCIRTIQIKEIAKYAQDAKFVISSDKKYIFDVLMLKSNNAAFFKINIETGNYQYVQLYKNGAIENIIQANTSVLIMHSLLGDTYITYIKQDEMNIEKVYTKATPPENGTIMLFDKQYLLFENMEIVDINNDNIIRKLSYPYERMKHGYFIKAKFSHDKKYLFFIFSERIIVFDFSENKVIKEYDYKYCGCAEILPNNIIVIATWEKVFLLDFI